jgi:hypothetical protein
MEKEKIRKNPSFTSALMFRGVMVVYGGTGSPFGLTTSNNVVACNLETGNFHRYGIPFFFLPKFKGLVACCHSFFLFIFTLFEQTYNFYKYSYYSSSTLLLSSWLPLGRGLLWGAEPRFEFGLLYSKPTRYCLSHAAPMVHKREPL